MGLRDKKLLDKEPKKGSKKTAFDNWKLAELVFLIFHLSERVKGLLIINSISSELETIL